ncbi:hyaluronidase-4 isoform X1 [Sinocyclocheilus rhinocerous]|nr:PREDICTED: hyaluronidase-4-like isoform X1 [Sinocyclocheilus rhinocerous]XP_016423730.1 PREDICTED: hyaluronidase-4-like isoform X1 [Sinocyclocheilus rhinocerous]XP_016423731.1 PREDICTED: hyaluronidase-4-like isoform X1 [Sinocyclocheilus rhinocerous]
MPGVPCGALQHHTVPIACAIICSWLLILVHSAFCQKPAKLPLVGRKPFLAAWNAPLDMCTLKYNINVSLELFHISGSPRAVHTGQNVTIFYANRLGYYPFYNEQGVPINGGLPQNSSLEAHLHKARKDIAHFIPSEGFRGLAVIDWEFWRPQWNRNWHKKDIYRQRSRELIAQAYLNVTEEQVEELARLRFEKSAMEFMQGTLKLGTQTRPHGLWGFYLYPDCHNYNVHAHNNSGTCPLQESQRNDQLFWLWNSSTAFFPALAIRKGHMDSIRNLHFSQNRVLESLRLASLTSLPYELPTFVYTRLGYRDEAMAFLTQKDLIHTIGESAALGAAGFVIWGDLNLTSSRHNCSKVKAFLNYRLGQYITNVTQAAEICSDLLCQTNGRCVRRDPQAPHYLHLSRGNYRILSNRNGTFTVIGQQTKNERQMLADRFRCHCYQGYEGERCDSIKPEETEEDNMIKEDVEEEEKKKESEDYQDIRDTAVPLQNAFILTALLLLLNFSSI